MKERLVKGFVLGVSSMAGIMVTKKICDIGMKLITRQEQMEEVIEESE